MPRRQLPALAASESKGNLPAEVAATGPSGSAFTWRMGSRMRPRSALRQARSKAVKRPAPIGMRFEVPLGSIAARALAHLTGQGGRLASPATEVRGTPIKGQRWNPPELRADGDNVKAWAGDAAVGPVDPPPKLVAALPLIKQRGNSTTKVRV